jgi:Major intrinsic protein
MVLAIILFMGAVSGAHLNPAVSLAFAVRGDFRWRRVPGYIIVQLLGATLACLFLLAVFGNVEHLGATLPGPGYKDWQAFLMEIALTGVLLSVILGTASAAQNVGAIGALGVGGAERWCDRRTRRRRLHRPRWPLVRAGERHLDEPGALIRPRPGQRRLDRVLGIRRRTADRRRDRGRLRDHPARPRWRPDLPRGRLRCTHPRPLGGKGQALTGHRRGEGRAARTRADEPTPGACNPRHTRAYA